MTSDRLKRFPATLLIGESLLLIKGPGLIRGIFGLRFSEKVKFPVLFGLRSHHNMPYLQNLSSNIRFDVLRCHENVDNHSENAIFDYFPHLTAIFGGL